MNIKLAAIDLDGTLLDEDRSISQRCLAAIARASRAGVHVVLATARPPRSVRDYHRCCGLRTLTINYNGAMIYDPAREKVIAHEPIAQSLALKVITFARAKMPQVLVSVEIVDQWMTDRLDESFQTEVARAFVPDQIGPLELIITEPVTKLMLLGELESLLVLQQQLSLHFHGQLTIMRADRQLIQIMAPGVSKGAALARVARHYGVAREQVLAIGDAANDLQMLKWAGVAVAVDNADPIIKDAADHVVASNNCDGVAEALERFVLDGRGD